MTTSVVGPAVAFSIAALAVVALTPAIARWATHWGAVDWPDGRRKSHEKPVPRGGGVAIALAVLVAVPLVLLLIAPVQASSSAWLIRGLMPAVVVLLLVGVIDDVLTLTGIYKLIGQVLAVSVLVAGGTSFEQISLFGVLIPLGDFCIPFTIFFCLGAINAFNLIDGADALASTIGAIVCATLGVITATRDDGTSSLICLAMAGALVAFLRYNIPPAKVYLGDTGSMLIGLVVAAVAIDCSIKQEAAFVLAVPLAICAIPILDAGAALIRRVTTGQSVFAADRGHLHHALLLRGMSVGKTVAVIGGLSALTCGGALASYYTNNDLFALATTGGVFVTLAAARVFGHAEAALVASRSRSLVRSIVSRNVRRAGRGSESAVQLQGTRKWQKLWTALRETTPLYNVTGLTLQISIPQLHESFYANWDSNVADSRGETWRVTLPLMLDGHSIGKLSLVGAADGRQALADMQHLLDYLHSLQGEIEQVLAGQQEASDQSWKAAEMAPALN
jgi:UDP-GlcNAc:undecaprenyl-phosphate GlcNAc-1-phosphate transferase